MSKLKLLSLVSIALLVLNLFLLWFLLDGRPGHRGRKEPKEIIIKTLNLDKEQQLAYGKLIDWHRSAVKQNRNKMMVLRNKLYADLKGTTSMVPNDSVMAQIGRLQMAVEQINYKHFQDIKSLCRPDQVKAFNQICTDIAGLFAPPPPPHEKR